MSDEIIAFAAPSPAEVARVEQMAAIEIRDAATEGVAIDNLRQIKLAIAAVEERRTELKAPHLNAGRIIDEQAKRYVAPLQAVETALKRKVQAWREAERARVDEEQRRVHAENERLRREAEAEAARKRQELAAQLAAEGATAEDQKAADELAAEAVPVAAPPVLAAPSAPPATVSTETARATEVRRWTFEVVDKFQVPHEYLIVDERAIRDAVRAGTRIIPGVRIYQESSLSVGGR